MSLLEELSTEAKTSIDKMLAEQRNLNSNRINLYDYASRKSAGNPYTSPLNDAYDFLIDNGFVSSNNPYNDTNKFLVHYTSEGKRLHKAGSLLKYYNMGIPAEQQILNYLEPKFETEKNRTIQQTLGLEDVEFEKAMRKLFSNGYTTYEEICEGSYIDCGFSAISPSGREYLENLKNPKPKSMSVPSTIIGNGNFITVASGNIHQSNINITVTETNYNILSGLGVVREKIDELKKMADTKQSDKATFFKSSMKWLADVTKEVAVKGLTDNIDPITDFITNLNL